MRYPLSEEEIEADGIHVREDLIKEMRVVAEGKEEIRQTRFYIARGCSPNQGLSQYDACAYRNVPQAYDTPFGSQGLRLVRVFDS